jgi:hypothetical protein
MAGDHRIIEAMRQRACIREIWDRNDGKVPAPVETPPVTMETLASMEAADAQCDGPGEAPPEQVQERPEPVQ